MTEKSPLDWIALVLVIIGGLNWGIVGVAGSGLVEAIFGSQMATLSRFVYILVGLSALYMIYFAMKE